MKGSNDIKNVAAISAGNDEEIGQMIADALDKVGADGVLAIESSNSLETTVDVQEGMEIDRGYISPQVGGRACPRARVGGAARAACSRPAAAVMCVGAPRPTARAERRALPPGCMVQFVTNSERMLVAYENAMVLVTDMKIEAVKDIIPILEQVCSAGGTSAIQPAARCGPCCHSASPSLLVSHRDYPPCPSAPGHPREPPSTHHR